jgi:hypothetical protein
LLPLAVMDKKSRILLGLVIVAIVGSIGYTYYKTVILEDFQVIEVYEEEEVAEEDESGEESEELKEEPAADEEVESEEEPQAEAAVELTL